jgi:hypothetical protein
MITFECDKDGCDNKDVAYNFLGNPPFAECGGCKTILTGVNERPDPEVETPRFRALIEETE